MLQRGTLRGREGERRESKTHMEREHIKAPLERVRAVFTLVVAASDRSSMIRWRIWRARRGSIKPRKSWRKIVIYGSTLNLNLNLTLTPSVFTPFCVCLSISSSDSLFLSLCLSLSHSHTLLITCTCCDDQIKGTQDKDFSYSFSDSLSLSLD